MLALTYLHFLRFWCCSEVNQRPPSLPQLEPSNDAELISQVLVQHHNPFHAMESSLQLHGISLTPFLVHQTLLRLKNSSKIALSFFQYSQLLPRLQHFESQSPPVRCCVADYYPNGTEMH